MAKTQQKDLHTRAMLAGLRITAWTARKYDRKVSQEVADAHGASLDAGRYNKHLLPADAVTYKALVQHIGALRQLNDAQTLPWSDDGWRILPVKNYHTYMDLMRQGRHKFDTLLDEFIADYPALRVEAQRRFNGLFEDTDYPTDLRSRYSFDIQFKPVPSAGDWRVELSEEEIKILAEKTEQRARAEFEDAQNDAVKRLHEVVQRIHERLTATTKGEDGEIKPGIFRDSLIQNARDVCDVLKRINLADDPTLEQLRQQTEALAVAEPQVLREDMNVRVDTAKRAQSILDAMAATYGKIVAQ